MRCTASRISHVTDGGPGVMEAGGELTSGGEKVVSGVAKSLWRDPRALTSIVFLAFGFVYMIVNATSLIDQRQLLGQPIEEWRAWLLEITSFLAWIILLPVVLWAAGRLLSLSRPLFIAAGHVVACIAISLAHTAIMLILRLASFAFAGESYASSAPVTGILVFEFRKDIITYASIVLLFLIARRLVASRESVTGNHQESETLVEVRAGSRIFWLKPEEIDWVSAAGNYIELHGSFGTELARRTLSDIEEELEPHGFARVHRSRLVRKSSIASVETRQSGDFDITFRSGQKISGSRRFRANLV